MALDATRARYYLMLGLIIAAMVTVIGGLSAYRAYGQSYEIFRIQSEQMVKMQSVSLAKPVWDFNREDVAKLIGAFKSDPSFAYARVIGERGQVMSEIGRQLNAEEDHVMSIEAPIVFSGLKTDRTIGTLLVQYDSSGVRGHWLVMMIEQAATLFILVGSIVFLLVRALKSRTTSSVAPIFVDEQSEVRRMIRDVRALVLDIYDSNAVGDSMQAKLTRLEEILTVLEKKVRHAQA